MIVSSGTKSRSLSSSFTESSLDSASVPMSDWIKHLCVTLDWHLTMKTHISNLVWANFEVHPSSVHRCHNNSFLCLCSLVPSLQLSPQYLYKRCKKFKTVLLALCWMFTKLTISPHLASLAFHWLPIDSRIQYKFASQCYNCHSLTTPGCLTEFLKVYKRTCQLCSFSDTVILSLPSVRTHLFGQSSFSYAALSVWNSLPCKVRSCVHECFHLFWVCFGSLLCNELHSNLEK